MDEHNRHYLTQLHFRLRRSGFSFQHEDFLELQDALPSALEDIAGAEERAEKYKEMADELAEALRRIADPPLNHASWHGVADQMKSEARDALIKYNAMKGEE